MEDWLQAESELLHMACFKATPTAAQNAKPKLVRPAKASRARRLIAA
jgi:hypothetical protein